MPFPPLDYANVRAALDIHLDEETIPDEVIQLDIVEAAAAADVMARDPLAATYGDGSANFLRVARAFAYLAAARLAISWRPTEEETHADGDLRFRLAKFSPSEKAADLRALAEAQFVAYLGTSGTRGIAGSFGLASGRRGQ